MQCPSCQQGQLHYNELEELLPCQRCNHCEGNWLLLTDYLTWQTKMQDSAPETSNFEIEADESKQALICPVSGTLMTKYRISSQTIHKLDVSMAANAIWLDKGEWQLLKQQQLALKLNNIFTAPWQKRIRDELAHETFNQIYDKQFGETTHAKLKDIHKWLNSQDKKAEMLAYLITDDPYSATR